MYSALTNNATINWNSDYIYFENGSITNNRILMFTVSVIYIMVMAAHLPIIAPAFIISQTETAILTTNITFNNKGAMNLNSGIFSVNCRYFYKYKKNKF